MLPLTQQDGSVPVQEVSYQVVVPGSGQRLLAAFPGGGVAARLLEEVCRYSQGPGARQGLPLGGRPVEERPQRIGSFGGVPAYLPEYMQGGGQPEACCGSA